MAARHQFLGPSLGESGRLILRCTRCDYEVSMSASVAIRRFGRGATPHGIRLRSRCSVCDRTDHIAVTIR
jgi:hypothetical protein